MSKKVSVAHMSQMMVFVAISSILTIPALAQERTGVVGGPSLSGHIPGPTILTNIGNPTAQAVCTAATAHTNANQTLISAVGLQGFSSPFLILSSGNASLAPGVFGTFVSVVYGGQFDTARLDANCNCPTGRSQVSVKYTRCTEEIPSWINSIFQDPSTVSVSDGVTTNSETYTTDTMVAISNLPGGSSGNPLAPSPTPNDVVYNSCFNASRTVSATGLLGPVTVSASVRDAGDDILDTAIFVDDLHVQCRLVIDLKPGSNPNCTNLRARGLVPVAILSTAGFDATTVDPSTVQFAGAPALRCSAEDVDLDSDTDLVCHFDTQSLVTNAPNAGGCSVEHLRAMTFGGVPVSGSDVLCRPGQPVCNAGTPQAPVF